MLNQTLQHFFERHPDILDQENFAVAVSGGPDSMALAHALIGWGRRHNKFIHLISVNHGLRPEAAGELESVAVWAKEQAVMHHILTWHGQKPDTAIMEEARQARYALMAEYCATQNIQTLFIAHHQDDQAETFLIRLAKGSGLDGLGGMQSCRPYNDKLTLARPFLSLDKETLIKYCRENGIPFVSDPSNTNEDYLRPRLRGTMEVLAKEGLTSKRLAVTAGRLSRARLALDQLAVKAYEENLLRRDENILVVNFGSLKQQPEEIGLRVLQRMIETLRPASEYGVRMEKLEELFSSLWHNPENYKPRTLGKCKISLKNDKDTANQALWVEKE